MKMPLSSVRVMCRCFVVTCFVVFRSLSMMLGRVFVMFGGPGVVFRSLVRHLFSLVPGSNRTGHGGCRTYD
jgi:hypothetical protein